MKNKNVVQLFLLVIFGIILISNVYALTITDVSTSPKEIQAGERVSVSLTVYNPSNNDLKNVVVGLDLTNVPFSPYQSSSTKTFDKILEDDSETASFDLVATSDAESKTYKIPVSAIVENATQPQLIGVISILINSKPELDLLADTPGLIRGQINDLTIKIVNNGIGDAKGLSIKFLTLSNAQLTGTDYVFIGDITREDFDTAKFSLFVNQNAGTLSIPVQMDYKDSTNKVYSEVRYVNAKTLSMQEAISIGLIKKSNTSLYMGIVVGLIVLYLIYRYIRKRRKNKNKVQ